MKEIEFTDDGDLIPQPEKPVAPVEGRQNVQRKNVVAKAGQLGTVAHYHRAEDEFEIWDEPCVFIEHTVNVPKGLDINGTIYQGKVIVPTCVAGTLGVMENHWANMEEQLYRGRSFSRVVGSF